MANTIVSLTTSAFAVDDPAAFAVFCERWTLDSAWQAAPSGDGQLVDVSCEEYESLFDEATPGVADGGDFTAELAAHIARGWVVVCTTRHRVRGTEVFWHAEAITAGVVVASASGVDSGDGDDLDTFQTAAKSLGRISASRR